MHNKKIKVLLLSHTLISKYGQDQMNNIFYEYNIMKKIALPSTKILLITPYNETINVTIVNALLVLGFGKENIFRSLEDLSIEAANFYIYVCGEDPLEIKDYMIRHELWDTVKELILREEVTYIGADAGAAILGEEIGLLEKAYNKVHLEKYRGLEILPETVIIPCLNHKEFKNYLEGVSDIYRSYHITNIGSDEAMVYGNVNEHGRRVRIPNIL